MSLRILLREKYVLFAALYHLLKISVCSTERSICCFPKQFESNMYVVSTGTPNTGTSNFGFANGTIKTAYDSINERTYLLTKYTTRTFDDPGHLNLKATFFLDYKSHVFYQVLFDVFCQQGPVDSDLFIECIPKNATLIGEGYLGDTSTVVQTFMTTLNLLPDKYQLVASVIHTDKNKGECMPVQYSLTTYPLDDDADVIVSDIHDVTRGIKDESIFTPPQVCSKKDIPIL